jgi:PKD repeat protein
MLLLLATACSQQATTPTAREPDPHEPECVVDVRITADRTSGVLPLPIRLSADATCVEGEPQWDLGDGTTAQGWDVEHTYLGSGDFTVRLTVDEVQRKRQITVGTPDCPDVAEPVQVGVLGHDELDEASGLSHSPSGVLWTHNDSGDTPRLFALATTGETLGTVTLIDAPDGDWEDSTRLVGSDQVTLFVGDIGDNAADRDAVIVYVLAEPEPTGDVAVDDWLALELSYPDGPRNADTLMVDPVDGALLIVADDGGLYRKPAPHEPGTHTVMAHVATLPLDRPTGGELSPMGDRLAVRNGSEARLWLIDRSLPLADSLDGPGCPVPLADEVRGEALAFAADGSGIYTVSEELYQPIWSTAIPPVTQPCDSFEAQILRSDDGELPLTVDFGIDTACVPQGLASVVWDFGDRTVTAETATRTWRGSGHYPVSVTVTDQSGQVAQAETTVVVTQQSCPTPGEPTALGALTDTDIVEASGLAHSVQTGLLWTHNDSGGVGELFGLSETGEVLERISLDIHSGDWEDLSYAETADGWMFFVGDIGDNAESRDDIHVYLVPEDDPDAWGVMDLTYDDGESHNCESIAVDPQTGDLVVITKSYEGDTRVYVKPPPHADGDQAVLTEIAALDTMSAPFSGSEATTAADFSPLGNLLAIRTYSDVWLFRRDASEPLVDAFDRAPCNGGAPSEQQGESVAFATDGSGYFMLSEGTEQPLNFVSLE